MKRILFSNWHLMRYFRVALALFLFFQAYETKQWLFIAFGVFFLFQAIFNWGCGPNGCHVTYKNQKDE
ncbi:MULTISPECIES: hypothetical protein [Flavobacterium]|uniref:DUF2892 domain-containing protein n=1 Tax=Flavobacterium sedimenticola TaxID=3043286 RepID=A0ABT6XT52_9FLAO|nr:hypothetical protein [Flavobacterium sedimenticola]MDI9258283.1 hypothetical protein [Flavobacterium sedimenticola]